VAPGSFPGMIGTMPVPGNAHEPNNWRTNVAHLDGLETAAVVTDHLGTIVYCNTAAERVLGRPRSALVGTPFLAELVPEPHHGATREIFEQVALGRTWTGQMPGYVDGAVHTFDLMVNPMWEGDRIVGALLLGESVDADEATSLPSRRTGERLARLARVTAELVTADNFDAVTKIVVSHAADAAGAVVASMTRVVDENTLAIVGLRGADQEVARRWATFPIDSKTPASDTVRTGRPILLAGRQAIDRHYPGLDAVPSGERSLLTLPLNAGGRTIGAIGLWFPGTRIFDVAETEFLTILADTCAQAMERIEAQGAAAARATKLKFLADASAELAASLDYKATLRRVAWLGVPAFADWCSISLLEDGELRTIEIAHIDPEKVALAEELQRRYPADPDAPQGAWNIVRTGRSELIPVITDELLQAGARDEEHLRIARELNLRSAVSAPLVAHGKVLGVMSWVSADEGRQFSDADLSFVEDLAQRAAVAIDNSQLHSETREAAMRLQQAVLPDRLPDLPGWEFASFYGPSGRTEVGGDFYDVLPVDHRVVLFVGDVMGRGVAAAAAMAQMRAAVRSYAAIDPDPASVVSQLDTMFEMYEYGQLVTLVYVLADPERGELSVVNAGHPPPLVLHPDGRAETLTGNVSAPLGLQEGGRESFRVGFGEAEALLLYTDGLIERRAEDIDVGQTRLTETCSAITHHDLAACLEQLVVSVRDHTREDDVAALAARRLPRS
jgi:PAS domain S-box-containing protein